MPPKNMRTTGIVRLASVMLMAGLWLGLVAFSTSARLHQSICDHAQQSSHECVLVSFAKHQPWTPIQTTAVQPPMVEGCLRLPPFRVSLRSVDDLRLHPGRAPPVALLPS